MKSLLKAATSVAALLLCANAVSAADLPRSAPPPVFVPVPVFTWTGFYVGVNASGVVDGDFSARLLPPLPAVIAKVSAAGYVAGGTVGVNYQFTPGSGFVVGLEGDIGYSDIHNRLSIGIPGVGLASAAVVTDSYYATARGRIGYAFDRLLVFGTGGYAATEIGVRASLGAFGFGVATGRQTAIDGWTVGGGLEYAITNNVSVKAEYAYSEFRKNIPLAVIGVVPIRFRAGLDTSQIKVGVNYKFNWF
jgi:outer membrane immunogenic protein